MGGASPLRVGFVTQQDALYLSEFFRRFFGGSPRHPEVEPAYALLLRPFDESWPALAGRMLRFYGPVGFARMGWRYARRKVADAAGIRAHTVGSLLREAGVSVLEVEDVNAPETVERVEGEGTDVLVSVAAPQIFAAELLTAPTWGAINVHAAELPRYRGMMPNFWAMYHGDPYAGITVHTMDEEIDRGRIVLQDRVEIRADDTLHTLILRSKRAAADLLWRALGQIADGDVSLSRYEGKGSYFSFPSPEEVAEFRERGRRLI